MTLFNKIRGMKKTLASIILAGTMAITGAGCSGGGGGGGGGDPVNHNPTFTSTPVTTATEESAYTYNVVCNDLDSDDLSFSIPTGLTGMTITKTGANTATVNYMPDDTVSAATHPITIRVSDGKSDVDQNYNLYVVNVEPFVVWAYNRETGAAIPGAQVTLGSDTITTDGVGRCEKKLPDGDYTAMVKDMTGTCDTYKPGFVRISKTSKLEQEARLFPVAHRDAINDTFRRHGAGSAKYVNKPKLRIHRFEEQSGNDVGDATINAIKDTFKTDLSGLCQNAYSFTDSDIEVVASKVTGQPPDGYIFVYWDNSIPFGGNSSWLDVDNKTILRSYCRFNTTVGKNVHLQEMGACFFGSTASNQVETTDINYEDKTAFYASSANLSYKSLDNLIGEATYSLDKDPRPAGNKDLGSDDNHDVNPSTYQWNQTLTAPMSLPMKSIAPASTYEYDDCPDEDYETPSIPYNPREEVNEVF